MLFLALIGIFAATHVRADDLKVIVMGDWGTDNEDQYAVAERMGIWAEEHGADFLITTGDNFYSNGVDAPDDDRFDVTWKDVYTHPGLADLPWYISVGNHDHDDDGREWYQVFYSTRNPTWVFPDLTYSWTAKAGDARALFVAIDTQSIRKEKNDHEQMLKYLNYTLAHSTAEWKLVFGHHPSFSCGGHSGSSDIRNYVTPIMIENNVDFFLAGHDHNLQHWVATDGVDVDHVTSGGGGRRLYEFDEERYEKETDRGMTLVNFSYSHGFAYLEMNESRTKVTYIDQDGEILYEFTREK